MKPSHTQIVPARTPAWGLSVAVATALLLSACASNVKLDDASSTTGQAGGNVVVPGGSGSDAARGEGAVAAVDTSASTKTPSLSDLPKTIYFDYDSFSVKPEATPTVEGHAKVLQGSRTQRLTLEGHTDERGGREYNLALGQKRAEAVVRALTVLGVSAEQLEPVSMGEEKPAAGGSDEAAWAKNRRVEFKAR
jgi:peptidoglycan-associated lipoprotein